MSNTPWTFHVTQSTPSRKTYRIMEGIMPIATCKHKKHARHIIDLHNDRERLRQAERVSDENTP